jgi:CRP-like cAMP-binding protein
MSSTRAPVQLSNRILGGLPAADRSAVLDAARPVNLEFGQHIYRDREPIEAVYFPESGVISMVNTMTDGTTIEVGTIGSEGMAGLGIFLGVTTVVGHTFVQVPGTGWRLEADTLRKLLQGLDSLTSGLGRYTQALFTHVAQGAACNRAHPVERRCARWLLLTHDRVNGDEFALTQEFLAQMLGVRRAGVSEAASVLQRAGYIAYTRGVIQVLDRRGLETASCECYEVIRREIDRLLPPV